MDVEIAQINISVGDSTGKGPAPTESDPLGDGLSSVAWHYDSYPFVCVVMLSDCSDMVGGETALKTATGEIKKIRGPAMVRVMSSSASRVILIQFIRAPQ